MDDFDFGDFDFFSVLCSELDAYAGLLVGLTKDDLDRQVAACAPWTLYELTDHLGNGNLWATTAVQEGHGRNDQERTAPHDPASLHTWFLSTVDQITTALDADAGTEAWTFSSLMPRTVGFWQRRRAHETRMHRWDAQNALGTAEALDPPFAADAVTEVFELFAPRMVKRGLAAEPQTALKLNATDVGRSWTYGPGEPVSEVAGAASDLALLLWNRIGLDAAGLTWTGDRAAGERVVKAPLVP
ncbi:maleylpyruvate isomerase family mycothiol-dependent enzyme [Catenulispora pinisilvae]|uniref:maleylpyruvate isomerase family mycothiol-dependent enzyme n=1 Tax=Catenulispora pinisilvae TaxID=2705253 RepID=UPI001892416F|nr:maleylpyruvate isomerase family mycothiol-dependent enzyme [Catenulispora pinisilvae]